jgi:signal transduction histidine kinase
MMIWKMPWANPTARRIHVLTFAVYIVASAYAYTALGSSVPPFKLTLAGAIFVGFALVWTATLVWRYIRVQRVIETERFSQTYALVHMWLYNLVLIASFWILMPHADDAMRLLAVIFTMGVVAVEAILSAQTEPTHPLNRSLLYGPAIAISLYSIVYGGRFAVIVIVCICVFTIFMVVLKKALLAFMGQIQQALLATEAALGQVAAERDARTRFLAAASHDLAQPLQAARMFADAAMRQRAGAKRDKAIANLGWAFDSTEALLEQMLDRLRPDSVESEVHLGDVAIGPIMAQVAAMHGPHAAAAEAIIRVIPSSLIAHTDATLTERTISNFIANALRHAKARRILVGATYHGPRLRIWVIDDGVGIAAPDAARLFDDYFQGSDHDDEVRGGFGLGLASARRAAQLIGGTVGFDARWTGGAAFFLELSHITDISLGGEILPDL